MSHRDRLIREDLEVVLRDLFARNFPSYASVMKETWEQRLEREIWRRSIRGRWFYVRGRIRIARASLRYGLAKRIYPEGFRDDD